MISDDQIFASFKNIRGTPQYFHNMLLDVLDVYTFFLTFSSAVFHWTDIIQVVARQYWDFLTDENVSTENDVTDSDDNIEDNDHIKEKEIIMSSVVYPTVMHDQIFLQVK